MSERRDETRRLHRARHDTVAELRRFLHDYWSTGLERLRDAAEHAEHARAEAARRDTGREQP